MLKQVTLIISLFFFTITSLWSQFSFTTTGTTYSQDFSTYLGTLPTVPANWSYSNEDFSPGGTYSNDDSYSNSVSNRALDQEGAGEYAIGMRRSSGSPANQTISVLCANNIASTTINSLTITWDVEQYSTSGRATEVFLSNNLSGTITGANDVLASTGADANLATVEVTSRSITYSGLNISPGSNFSIEWNTRNGSGSGGNAHIGIDNVSIAIASFTLPIELSKFDVERKNNTSILSWETASEVNNHFFSLEKSDVGDIFREVGKITGKGTSLETNNYFFIDNSPNKGRNYYRLKQVDFDGTYTYSKTISIDFDGEKTTRLYPTLATESLNLSFDDAVEADRIVQIFNNAGILVQNLNIDAEDTFKTLDVSNLQAGNYYLKIQNSTTIETLRFVKI